MSGIGKTFAFLSIIGLLAAVFLGAKLGRIQNAWALRIAAETEKNASAVASLREAEKDFALSDSALIRVKHGRGLVWDGVNVSIGQTGNINVNIGDAMGLKVRDGRDADNNPVQVPPAVQAFQPGPEGFVYVGEFIADTGQLGAQSAQLRPTWVLRPGEIGDWDVSRPWRFREIIPPGDRALIDALNDRIRAAIQMEQDLALAKQKQDGLLADAQSQLNTRRGELLGDPNVPATRERPELTIGLVAAITNVEEERNAVQNDVDKLRRGILAKTEIKNSLRADLEQAVSQLPKPDPTTSAREPSTPR